MCDDLSSLNVSLKAMNGVQTESLRVLRASVARMRIESDRKFAELEVECRILRDTVEALNGAKEEALACVAECTGLNICLESDVGRLLAQMGLNGREGLMQNEDLRKLNSELECRVERLEDSLVDSDIAFKDASKRCQELEDENISLRVALAGRISADVCSDDEPTKDADVVSNCNLCFLIRLRWLSTEFFLG
jgi:hypothetical protein